MISIIIPVKNGSKYIKGAIESIRSQTEKNVEIVVIDDASTDDTQTILSEIQKTDLLFKIIRNEKSRGPGASRHIGILASSGELIAFLDDDDRWISPQKLSKQSTYLQDNPECVIVGSAKNSFTSEDGSPYPIRRDTQPKSDEDIRKEMLWRNPFITSSVMLKKEAYLKVGGFTDMYLAEDYELWMRLGKTGKMANIEGCDIQYTVRASNASNTRRQEMNKIVLDLTKKYRGDYPSPLYYVFLLKAYMRVWLFNLKQIF